MLLVISLAFFLSLSFPALTVLTYLTISHMEHILLPHALVLLPSYIASSLNILQMKKSSTQPRENFPP